ncbi:MAG: HisA/HisF-related TIM barrel protein [Methylotenera sp.]
MMQIIPVIDLLDGVVVHAKKGDRKNYQPIQSLLTPSSKPLEIVAALLEYYPFQQLYIADLNAIQKLGDDNKNFQVVETISQHYPNIQLWIDVGISNSDKLDIWRNLNFNVILGSENFSDLENYLNLKKQLNSNFMLSLDFMLNGYQGPLELLDNTQYWPKDVILMSLAHVGANQGVNMELLKKFKQHAAGFNLFAAGGIRSIDDLTALKQAGIHGVLIASALHQKQLSRAEIRSLMQ